MMKKISKFYFIAASLILVFSSCSMSRQTAGYYDFPTECLGSELDGSQTLLVFADGRNRLDAVEQAKKNALREVIFKGIKDGKSICDPRPLVPEVNADRKYEAYFAKFFEDGGEYLKYVSLADERIYNKIFRDRTKGRKQIKNSVVVRVEVLKLKEKLRTDEIIK
jgi:hypothetical protein